MTKQLAKRVQALTPSTTLAITAKAKELKDAGVDIIGLGAGEPDYNTPEPIIQAAYASMEKGLTKYTPAGGLPALKDAVIAKLKRDNELTYERSEIMVGVGAKHVLYTLFQVILNEGDEVIIPAPYWVSYTEQVKLAGGVPVIVEATAEHQFKITPEQLEEAMTERTVAVIINSPSNPTGMIYNESELRELAAVAERHDCWIVSDEIYEKLIYDGKQHFSIAQISDAMKARIFVVNGVSKSHAMTGWRIGYVAGPKEVVAPMTDLASHSTSNPTTPSQYAAIEAYNGSQTIVEEMRADFEGRLNEVYPLLQQVKGFHVIRPEGAFYLLPDVTEAMKHTGYSSVDEFSKALLEEANVAVIPGSAFGSSTTIRLSYATSIQALREAIQRIQNFVEQKWQD